MSLNNLVTCRFHCGQVKDLNETTGVAQLVGRSTTGWELYKVSWESGCYGYTSNPPTHLTKIPMQYESRV